VPVFDDLEVLLLVHLGIFDAVFLKLLAYSFLNIVRKLYWILVKTFLKTVQIFRHQLLFLHKLKFFSSFNEWLELVEFPTRTLLPSTIRLLGIKILSNNFSDLVPQHFEIVIILHLRVFLLLRQHRDNFVFELFVKFRDLQTLTWPSKRLLKIIQELLVFHRVPVHTGLLKVVV
jgi:hypothetical protein